MKPIRPKIRTIEEIFPISFVDYYSKKDNFAKEEVMINWLKLKYYKIIKTHVIQSKTHYKIIIIAEKLQNLKSYSNETK